MATRSVSFVVFIALLVLLHFVLHLGFGLGPGAPDFVVVAVLMAARRLRAGLAAGLGLVLGILDDTLAITSFGASAVALTLVGYLAARSRDLFEGESAIYFLVYLFLGKWLRDTITLIMPGDAGLAAGTLIVKQPLIALWTALAGVVAVMIYRATSGEEP